MTESKQKRKTPLTTIAISQEYAQKLDEYIKGVALTRKDFVELAIDYFLRTGFDIRSEAFDLSPLERITDRLESSAKVMEQHNEGTEAVRQLLQVVREQTAKQLPAPDIIAQAAEENRRKNSDTYGKKTTDCVTKSKTCKPTRKRRTGNCAGYVMNKRLSGKYT